MYEQSANPAVALRRVPRSDSDDATVVVAIPQIRRPNPPQSLLPNMSVAAILREVLPIFEISHSVGLSRVWHTTVELVNYLDVLVDGREMNVQRAILLSVSECVADTSAESPATTAPASHAFAFKDACDEIGLEEECRSRWCEHFDLLALEHSIGHRISDIDHYVSHRGRTGHLLGLMLADVIPLRFRNDGFNDLAAWIASLGSCAELVDSFWDVSADHDQGHSAIKPTIRNRYVLLRAALSETSAIFERIPVRLRVKLIVKVFIMGLNRSGRLNRFRRAF